MPHVDGVDDGIGYGVYGYAANGYYGVRGYSSSGDGVSAAATTAEVFMEEATTTQVCVVRATAA